MKRDDDPERLLSSSSSEDASLRALLQAGRDELPKAVQLEALATKLGPILGPGGGGGGGGGGAARPTGTGAAQAGAGATATVVGGTMAKVIVVVAAGVVVSVAAWRLGKTDPPQPVGLVAPAVAQPSAALVLPPPDPTVAAPSSTAPAAQPTVTITHAASSSAPADPDREVKLLQRAQDALAADPAQALSICGDHARAFPQGLLAQEREVIAVDALMRLGRTDEATARAVRFEGAYPSSTHLRRIEALVGKKL